MKLLTLAVVVTFLFSCSKEHSSEAGAVPVASVEFTQYIILKGEQYTENNPFVAVSYQEMKFQVKFDGSAVYHTIDPLNQDDINKLYGFSDNNSQHHLYSARIGWRWSNGSLRLFAYIYNNGNRAYQEIATVEPGKVINCSIKVDGDRYIFSVDKATVTLPRAATTVTGSGYKLYPYFGGDELAPHDISIWIREL